jgi:diguanylate cyclase (GGDEF)-like protein/putative nucleotidyltransferase with HDIG domain
MKNLSIKANSFILITLLTGGIILAFNFRHTPFLNPLLWVLTALAAVLQVLKVEGSTQKSSYNISWLVYGFALISLGMPALLFVILVSHLVEWAWYRYPWYIQTFNIANFMIAGLCASQVYQHINPTMQPFHLIGALGVLVGLATFTLINHFFVGMVIKLARGQSFSQSGVFALMTLVIDFSVIGMGAATALVWMINPFGIILSLLPIYLIYSTLKVPALQRQTEIDPKTGLYNARFFAEALERELERAHRFERPLTVVLGDLDMLRNINNTYGHIAGDKVLIGIAEILQQEFRDYDVVARFGGEEFAILMPECQAEEAYARVDEVRAQVEVAEFEVPTSVTPIQVTVSFGIASREDDGQTAEDIVHNADVSLYHAKLKGRNRTCIYSSNGIEKLFTSKETEFEPQEEISVPARLEGQISTYEPNPLREKTATRMEVAAKNGKPHPKTQPDDQQQAAGSRSRQGWMINAFISVVFVLGLVSLLVFYPPQAQVNWLGLAFFGLIVLLTEGLSIDVYVKDTSVSISAAPFIAGVTLFGPVAALILGLIMAATAMLKHHSPVSRLLFNTGNHLISGSIVAGLILLSGQVFVEHTVLMQFSLALIAGLGVFISSTMIVAAVMGLSMGQPMMEIWKAHFSWLWPYYLAFGVGAYALVLGYLYAGVIGVVTMLIPVLTLRFAQVQFIEKTTNLVSQLKKKNVELENYSQEVSDLNEDLLLSLSNVIDLRDTFTRGHSEYVSRYAVMMGKQLGLSQARLELLYRAGMLHDIGKIGIPDSILYKPGPLSREEYELIKEHSQRGAEIIHKNLSLAELVPIIHHHHERMDGCGYPDGLVGEQIPLEARILCVADAIEAMASDRPYREAMTPQDILRELQENAGSQFDPQVVEAFCSVVACEGMGVIVNSTEVFLSPSLQESSGRIAFNQGQLVQLEDWMVPVYRNQPPDTH